ncbi:phosphate/phosphite/phosphonate ABC transporter substrate-binding protein [Variovorax sp. OV329]|uniref:phosphate/phosphite/phosphonate ABC transporter substrate-binding protein n=1 Tax=Variovorax sp. OV329 TaxID=1882825 RepID=UPI0008E250FA|nr:PhnD/SsuA/transferrin family substrate-binding protein [Variovorax sp. OV329]SFM03180.1 ABC-type phosphate/phosphonate transport system, substrate-binding protein [Variovorax sp. OV329]
MQDSHAGESGPNPSGKSARVRAAARLPLLAALLLASAATSAQGLVIGVTEGVTYRATDPEIEAKFAPIAEALGKALKQPVSIKVLSTYNASRAAMQQQQVDVVFLHPAHLAFESTKSGRYKSVAWTSGYTDYKVSFLCKDAQPISNWKEFAGKSLVTPDPDSITAVITRAMLREQGLQDGSVKLSTTRYQDAVPFYVQNGFTAYGATASAGVIRAWKGTGGKTCAESRAVPIKQWLASSKLDATTTATVRETLLELSTTDAGKKALATSGYTSFVAPSAELEKTLTSWLGV